MMASLKCLVTKWCLRLVELLASREYLDVAVSARRDTVRTSHSCDGSTVGSGVLLAKNGRKLSLLLVDGRCRLLRGDVVLHALLVGHATL